MAVALGTPALAALSGGGVTTTTFAFTSTTNPLYVRIAFWAGGATGAIDSVTYNTTGLVRIAQSALSQSQDRAEIWRLTSPASGGHNVVVTSSNGGTGPAGSVAVANATGLNTSAPEGTAATNASSVNDTTTGSLSISGAATGDLTIVAVANGNGAAITPSASGGGAASEDFDSPSNGEGAEGFTAADATTSVSASWTGSTSWAIAAIPLKTATGNIPPGLGPVVSMQQPFISDMSLMR